MSDAPTPVQMDDVQFAEFTRQQDEHNATVRKQMARYQETLEQLLAAQLDPKPPIPLRDWFAGQALANMNIEEYKADQCARWAYEMADAMLEARK